MVARPNPVQVDGNNNSEQVDEEGWSATVNNEENAIPNECRDGTIIMKANEAYGGNIGVNSTSDQTYEYEYVSAV